MVFFGTIGSAALVSSVAATFVDCGSMTAGWFSSIAALATVTGAVPLVFADDGVATSVLTGAGVWAAATTWARAAASL